MSEEETKLQLIKIKLLTLAIVLGALLGLYFIWISGVIYQELKLTNRLLKANSKINVVDHSDFKNAGSTPIGL